VSLTPILVRDVVWLVNVARAADAFLEALTQMRIGFGQQADVHGAEDELRRTLRS